MQQLVWYKRHPVGTTWNQYRDRLQPRLIVVWDTSNLGYFPFSPSCLGQTDIYTTTFMLYFMHMPGDVWYLTALFAPTD